MPALAATNWITEQCGQKVENILNNGGSRGALPSVFDAWAAPSEKRNWRPSVRQITADAFTFHGAGTDTTAHTLTTATWHLMKNPAYSQRLRKELEAAIPDPQSEQMISVNVLENLPYLVRQTPGIVEPVLIKSS
jgi:cytochrome P450